MKADNIIAALPTVSMVCAVLGHMFFGWDLASAFRWGLGIGFAPIILIVLMFVVMNLMGWMDNDLPPCALRIKRIEMPLASNGKQRVRLWWWIIRASVVPIAVWMLGAVLATGVVGGVLFWNSLVPDDKPYKSATSPDGSWSVHIFYSGSHVIAETRDRQGRVLARHDVGALDDRVDLDRYFPELICKDDRAHLGMPCEGIPVGDPPCWVTVYRPHEAAKP